MLPPSRTRVSVDHAGLSPLLVPLLVPWLLLDMHLTPSQSNKWLIAQLLEVMVAMVVCQLTPCFGLSLDTSSSWTQPIHTLDRMELALKMPHWESVMSLKFTAMDQEDNMVVTLLVLISKLTSHMDQSLLLFKLTKLLSRCTPLVSSMLTAETTLTTLSSLLDTVDLEMILTSSLRTPGVPTGVRVVTLGFTHPSAVSTCTLLCQHLPEHPYS